MRLGNAAQYAPGSFSDIVLVRNFGEKNHEFVPALAAEGIAIADAFSQSLRDGLQKDVAGVMAVFVVHRRNRSRRKANSRKFITAEETNLAGSLAPCSTI